MSSRLYQTPLVVPASKITVYDSQGFVNGEDSTTTASLAAATGGELVLFTALAVNKGGSVLWLQFFDSAGTLASLSGATPAFMPIPLSQNVAQDLLLNDQPGGRSLFGHYFTKGIVWAASTTAGTLTLDSTNSVWLTARWQQ